MLGRVTLALTAAIWPAAATSGGVGAIQPGLAASEAALQELSASDPERRLAAVVRLGAFARPAGLQRLSALLDSAEPAIRLAAARALVRAGDAATVSRLTSQAADERPANRFEALTVLRDAVLLPDAARRAAERTLDDGDPVMRLAALAVLTAHPSMASVPTVAGALGDGNRDVRMGAIRLLGASQDPRALLPMLEHVDSADRSERMAIVHGLGELGRRAALDPGAAVSRQLEDPDEEIRAVAIQVLGRLRASAAVPALVAMARRRPDEPEGRRAISALGAIADQAAIRALTAMLSQPAPALAVEHALCQAGSAAVAATTAILSSGFPTSASGAARVLGAIGDRRATPPLLAVLQSRPLVALAAIRALERLRDPDAVPALIAAFRAPRYAAAPSIREACLRALTAIGDGRAAELVDAAARDRDADVRAAAVGLAATVHRGLTRDGLAALFDDPEVQVRSSALDASADLGSPHAVPLLLEILMRGAAGSSEDRAKIGDALRATAGITDGPALWSALPRMPTRNRTAVLRALAHAGTEAPPPPRAEELLLEALSGGEGSAALAAAELLQTFTVHEATIRTIISLMPRLEAATRSRLCPTLARAGSRAADAALVRILDEDSDEGVRAAAAWAAASRRIAPVVNAALARARASRTTAVSENAAAALALALPAHAFARVRLVTGDGQPGARQWLRLSAGTLAVWTLTDGLGEARFSGLPPGPYRLSVDKDAHEALTVATRSGRSPAITPLPPCSRAAASPARP